MNATTPLRVARTASIILLLTTANPSYGQSAPATAPPNSSVEQAQPGAGGSALTAESAPALLATTRAELDALPASPAEGSVEARVRSAVQRRVALVEEFVRAITLQREKQEQRENLGARESALRTAFSSSAPPAAPVETSKEIGRAHV